MTESCVKERAANFLLRGQVFHALISDDAAEGEYVLVNKNFPVTKNMFPIVNRIIKTGSRAEKVYLAESDFDYIYEIGPNEVYNNIDDAKKGKFSNIFYCEEADYIGYYYIKDENGDFLYQNLMKAKLAPMIAHAQSRTNQVHPHGISRNMNGIGAVGFTLKSAASDGKTNASLSINDIEDSVIAMVLNEWPEQIWKTFANGEGIFRRECLPELESSHLYLITKPHPKSSNQEVEWRLSFSMPEKVLMLSLPEFHRKVFLICKYLRQKKLYKIESYVLKTALLWKLDEYMEDELNPGEEKLFLFVQSLFRKVLEFYEKKCVPNYFIPKINLLMNKDTAEIEEIVEMLKSFIEELSDNVLDNFKLFSGVDDPLIWEIMLWDVPEKESAGFVTQRTYVEKILMNHDCSEQDCLLLLTSELYLLLLYFCCTLMRPVWTGLKKYAINSVIYLLNGFLKNNLPNTLCIEKQDLIDFIEFIDLLRYLCDIRIVETPDAYSGDVKDIKQIEKVIEHFSSSSQYRLKKEVFSCPSGRYKTKSDYDEFIKQQEMNLICKLFEKYNVIEFNKPFHRIASYLQMHCGDYFVNMNCHFRGAYLFLVTYKEYFSNVIASPPTPLVSILLFVQKFSSRYNSNDVRHLFYNNENDIVYVLPDSNGILKQFSEKI